MTKSELFKAAHKMAKTVIKAGDNYSVTFGACIKLVLSWKGTLNAQQQELQTLLLSIASVAEEFVAEEFDAKGNICITEIKPFYINYDS